MDLKTFKAVRGLTLKELSELLGLPMATVHTYVAGTRRPETADRILLICAATAWHVLPADLRPDLAPVFSPPGGYPAPGSTLSPMSWVEGLR